jgi:hypothetical protein
MKTKAGMGALIAWAPPIVTCVAAGVMLFAAYSRSSWGEAGPWQLKNDMRHPVEGGVATRELRERLDHIERMITSMMNVRVAVPGGPEDGGASTATIDSIRSDLDVIMRRMEAILQTPAYHGRWIEEMSLAAMANVAKNERAVALAYEEFTRDRPGFQRGILFVPAYEILKRFGKPDHVVLEEGVERWHYGVAMQDGSLRYLQLTIRGGLVVGV